MFQHQDILYKNGALSLVWLVGNGGLKKTKGKPKLTTAILRANVVDICDRIIELLRGPILLHKGGSDNVLDIKTVSILIVGVSTMQKVQILAFKKEVDALYDLCRWKMPVMLNNQDIDLPVVKRNQVQDISLNMSQQEFGEMFIQEHVVDEVRTVHAVEAIGARVETPESVTLEQVDVLELLNAYKEEEKKSRKIEKKKGKEKKDHDAEMLRVLQESLARSRDITLIEVDHPSQVNMITEDPNFAFGDFEDQPMEVATTIDPLENDVATTTVDPLDNDATTTTTNMDVEVTDVPMEVTNPNQMSPVPPSDESDSFRLARSIQQDTPSCASSDDGRRRIKRRRMYWHECDEVIEFSGAEIREHIQSNRLDESQTRELLDAGVARLPPRNCFPMLRTIPQTVQAIQKFRGRHLGTTLNEMLTDIQNGQLNASTEERRREISTAADEDVSHAAQAQGDCSVTDPPPVPLTPVRPITSTSAVEVDEQPMELFDQNLMNDEFVLAEEHRTPPRQTSDDAVEEPGPSSRVQDVESEIQGGKYFHEMFPPATTTKAHAALEFQLLLKLQAQRKLVLEQDEPYGPIKIMLLNN